MKTTMKCLLIAITMVVSIPTLCAQSLNEFTQPPQSSEIVIGVITDTYDGGYKYDEYKAEYKKELRYYGDPRYNQTYYATVPSGKYLYITSHDYTTTYTPEQLLESLMNSAKVKYGEEYPKFTLRNFKYDRESTYIGGKETRQSEYKYTYKFSATVVVTNPKVVANENLSKAIDKALLEVREGSRIAIDQIRVTTGMDKEDYKDELVEILLDKGFKVVAKEYLEKLYEEQQNQQSGIYNDRTTVKENNFSAVGYYLNVRLTETALRVQAIDVSSGEYVGNVTIKLQ